MNKRILIVAAHPDDEVLGCGGAMALHGQQGDEVHLLIMADGVTSRSYDPERVMPRDKELLLHKKAIEKRKDETLKAAEILGLQAKHIYCLGLADQRLDSYLFLDLVKRIEKIKEKVQPDTVYTHFFNDLNLDHRITTQAVHTAFRPKPQQENASLFQFEVPESTYLSIPKGKDAFKPNHFVDISITLELKLQALEAYESEWRQYPDFRSREFMMELAEQRGQSRNFEYAEAFIGRRKINYKEENKNAEISLSTRG